jgi:hypothetical protein
MSVTSSGLKMVARDALAAAFPSWPAPRPSARLWVERPAIQDEIERGIFYNDFEQYKEGKAA